MKHLARNIGEQGKKHGRCRGLFQYHTARSISDIRRAADIPDSVVTDVHVAVVGEVQIVETGGLNGLHRLLRFAMWVR